MGPGKPPSSFHPWCSEWLQGAGLGTGPLRRWAEPKQQGCVSNSLAPLFSDLTKAETVNLGFILLQFQNVVCRKQIPKKGTG